MSKTTLALVAGVSAAASASITALIYSSRSKQEITAVSSTLQTPTTTAPFPNPAAPKPSPSAPLPALYPSPVDPAGVLQYATPGPVADVLTTPSHISSFNRYTRNPHWVAEHFTPQSLAMKDGNRRHSVFYEDTTVPPMFRAKLTDYARSGYDRGHQVPAADCKWAQEAMNSTFVLSNMCPQVGEGFNRDYWAHFEEFCRGLVNRYPSVRVVTGPLYLPKQDPRDGKWRVSYEVIGNPPNVAVPTHFYKIIYGEEASNSVTGRVALGAFVLPNATIPNSKSLSDFEVPLEAVERASGLTFANKLPMERRKRLCQEVKCDIIVREFDNARQNVQRSGGGQGGQQARR